MNRTYNMLEHLHDKPIAALTTDELEDVLIKYSPSHQATKTREIRAVFRWAKRRGFCQDNPADRLTFTEVRPKLGEREIIEPDDPRKLLSTCLTPDPARSNKSTASCHFEKHLIAPLAILFFAGVRPAEMERLQWRDIDLDEGMIDLPANITKRGRRRSIPIEPALKAWLQKHIELCGRQQGRVCKWGTVQLRRNREKLCRRAGIPWQQNWARHSYASYWLAQHGDLSRVSPKPTAHFANHLTPSGFVIPYRITADMAQSSSPAGAQSITQTESRVGERRGIPSSPSTWATPAASKSSTATPTAASAKRMRKTIGRLCREQVEGGGITRTQ
jgi:integrase